MPLFDEFMPDIADTLIDLFGTSASLIKTTSVYNAATGTDTKTDTTSSIIATPPAPDTRDTMPGQVGVQRAALVSYVKAASAPEIGNRVVIMGDTLQITKVERLTTGALVAAYIIHVG